MRHRIVAALALAAAPPARRMRTSAPGSCTGYATAALARSRERGWGLEHNPARLHVQTIDGLNHWLARRLPLAARIGLRRRSSTMREPLYAEAARRTVAMLDEDPVAAGLGGSRARSITSRGCSRTDRGHAGRARALAAETAAGRRPVRCGPRSTGCCAQALEAELAAVRGLARFDWQPLVRVCRAAARPVRRRVRSSGSRRFAIAAADCGFRRRHGARSRNCC